MLDTLAFLSQQLHELNSNFNISSIISLDIWNLNACHTSFNFIDLIKGIVPSSLYKLLHHIVNNKSLVLGLISMTYQFTHIKIKSFWLDHYSIINQFEKAHNISLNDRKSNTVCTGFPNSISHSFDIPKSFHNSFHF